MGNDFLGDFGVRDPFPTELESGFGEEVLGNVETEHKLARRGAVFFFFFSFWVAGGVPPAEGGAASVGEREGCYWVLVERRGKKVLQGCLGRIVVVKRERVVGDVAGERGDSKKKMGHFSNLIGDPLRGS